MLGQSTTTILFTDLVGSTSLLDKLGDRQTHELWRRHLALLRAAVHRHGGKEVKQLGDGLMVVFASATSAVLCAEEMQSTLATQGDGLQLRVGIDVGEPLQVEDDFYGRAVVMASRLCDASQGGQILISELVRALLGDHGPHKITSMPPLSLKGFAQPVAAAQVDWRSATPRHSQVSTPTLRAPTAPPLAGRDPGELVDRDRESAQIGAALDAARSGVGRLLLVEGAAGIGKTALAEAAVTLASDRGFRVLGAKAVELELELAWGIARQLFAPSLDEFTQLEGAPALALPMLDPTRAPPTAGAFDQQAAFHGLHWITAALAESQPLLLVVDDAQWCDLASLRFVAYLARRIAELSVFVLLTVRAGDPGAERRELVDLGGLPSTALVQPTPLSVGGVAMIVRDRMGDRASDEFCETCHDVTAGNALLLEELLRALRAESAPATAKTAARLNRINPETLSRSVLARLAGLPGDAAVLAQMVAVLGGDALLRRCAALAGLPDDAAVAAADALVGAEILRVGPRLEWVHPLVRNAVYEGISPMRRGLLHGRAARLLREEDVETDRVASQLIHAEPASDPEAVRTLRAAAADAVSRAAPEVAANLLERALAEPPVKDERRDVLEELGRAQLLKGDATSAAEALASVVARVEDVVHRARCSLALGTALMSLGRIREAIEVLDRASRDVAPVDGELALELEAELCTASQFESFPRPFVGPRVARLGRELTGDTAAERLLLAALSFERASEADPSPSAPDLAERAIRDGQLLAERGPESPALHQACYLLIEFDRFEAAREALDATLEESRRRGSAVGFVLASSMRCHLARCVGDLATAEAEGRQAAEVARLHGWELGVPMTFGYLLGALLERGALAEAEQTLDESLVGGGEVPHGLLFDFLLFHRAELRLAQGRIKDSLEDICELRRRHEARHDVVNPPGPSFLGFEALVRHHLGEAQAALDLARRQLARSRSFGPGRSLGIALRLAGLLTPGEPGIDHLREAVATLEASAARSELARGLVDLGGALRRAGKRSEAREHLRRGLDLAAACGASGLAARASEELSAAGGRPRRERISGVEGLTPSERRVAEMAARGMTNREIAQALFVTVKTVATHLTRTYAKLDITSRDQLASQLK